MWKKPELFNAENDVSFHRHEETGDVMISLPSGESVRISSNVWVSAVAAMTVHGEMNYAAFKMMHTGVGDAV